MLPRGMFQNLDLNAHNFSTMRWPFVLGFALLLLFQADRWVRPSSQSRKLSTVFSFSFNENVQGVDSISTSLTQADVGPGGVAMGDNDVFSFTGATTQSGATAPSGIGVSGISGGAVQSNASSLLNLFGSSTGGTGLAFASGVGNLTSAGGANASILVPIGNLTNPNITTAEHP